MNISTIEDSQRCFSVAVGSRRLLVLPFWVPFWETRSLPDRSFVTGKIGLSGAGSVGLYVATGLTFWFINT